MHDTLFDRRRFLKLATGLALASSSVAYATTGLEDGRPIVLVQEHEDAEVARILAGRGMRVLMTNPHADLVALLDSQHIPEAAFGATGRGADTVRAFAARKPTRCVGLVTEGATPQAFADAITELVRRAKWRT